MPAGNMAALLILIKTTLIVPNIFLKTSMWYRRKITVKRGSTMRWPRRSARMLLRALILKMPKENIQTIL